MAFAELWQEMRSNRMISLGHNDGIPDEDSPSPREEVSELDPSDGSSDEGGPYTDFLAEAHLA